MLRKFKVEINGREYDVKFEEIGAATVQQFTEAAVSQTTERATAPQQQSAPVSSAGGKSITAPMPGNILDIRVNIGDKVSKNKPLLILEAMKMENEIVAPQDGTITAIHVQKGDTVNAGTLLVSIS